MVAEHRESPRFQVLVSAEVRLGGVVFSAATRNLSAGGALLVFDAPIDEAAKLELSLFLTQDGIEDPDEDAFEVVAEVAWTAEGDGGKYQAGVRFDALDARSASILDGFLNKLL